MKANGDSLEWIKEMDCFLGCIQEKSVVKLWEVQELGKVSTGHA